MTKDVFISHHEKSAGKLAAQIAAELERVGISCWYAPRDITPGKTFREVIPHAICQCKVFLLIVNPQIKRSDEVLDECELAYRLHKKRAIRIMLFPVDGCSLPLTLYHFERCQRSDGSIPTLVRDIARILDEEHQPKSFTKLFRPQPRILKKGKCGERARYKLDERGLLTIFGTGPMKNYDLNAGLIMEYDDGKRHFWQRESNYQPWEEVYSKIRAVHIHPDVTSIGKSAFQWCKQLRSVKISSNSVVSIESNAFYGCVSLSGVTIPPGVSSIKEGAFYRCASLDSVTIPDSVSFIGAGAFRECPNLKGVILPANTAVAPNAFDRNTRRIRRK